MQRLLIRSRLSRSSLAVLIALSVLQPAAAQTGPYLSDLPKMYPTAYANWLRSLPYAVQLAEWLTKFDGVESPIRDVSIHGVYLKFGTVCVPHDCGDNIAGVLFTPRQDRIVAIVQLGGRNGASTTMVIGQMSNDEFACIRRLVDDYKATVC